MEKAIQKAIEGGYQSEYNLEVISLNRHLYLEKSIVAVLTSDPLFWQALGKAMGWGQWTKSLLEIEHEWELEHYLPDTGKTPVYMCKKCCARKVLDVITIEVEYEWLEIKPNHYTEREVLRGHGVGVKPTWQQYWHRFIDALSEGKTPDDFFKELLKEHD